MIADGGTEVHRLCVFDLTLDCGHIATIAVNGWYPVTVACCDRLGGTTLRGVYVPFSSNVEYVKVISERYEHRPCGAPRERSEVLGRRPRADGHLPARVGSCWVISSGDLAQ